MRIIRDYTPDDIKEISQLFYDTVHGVNIQDYTEEQCHVWADGKLDEEAWNTCFLQHHSLVVVDDDHIIGFGDMDDTGYLDHLYVHMNHQGQGIATMLCDALESACKTHSYTTHASITAKGFFASRGYQIVKQQEVIRKGIVLINYVMKKELCILS